MNFGELLGNEALKARLAAALTKGRLSHGYLIVGPSGSGKRTLARWLAAAMQCTAAERPCGRCAQCRKVLHGTHPDVISVDEPEKKGASVKVVRDACADLYIRPNEGMKKIYLFPRAQELNAAGQNALLKCVEEPPAYGVFLLLAENASRLLPTVRSRCVELRLSPLPEEVLLAALRRRCPGAQEAALQSAAQRSGGYLGQALALLEEGASLSPQTLAFASAMAEGGAEPLLRVLTPMERWKRDKLRPVLGEWYALLAAALEGGRGRPECEKLAAARSPAELLSAAKAVREASERLESNVSPAHLCGVLCVRLAERLD